MGNLSFREKTMVAGGGVLLLVFIAVQFIYMPAFDKRNRLRQVLAAEQDSLDKIRLLSKEYQALVPGDTGETGFIQNRGKRFSLFSFLDQKAAKSGIKKNIDYMKPNTRALEKSPYTVSIVKLKLKHIALKDFVRFMQEVESPKKGIQVVSLSLSKSGKEKKWLDVVLEAQTLVAQESGS